MRHDDRAEHAHDDEHRALGKRRRYPTGGSRAPVGMDDADFKEKREADEGNKPDDDLFDLFVGVGKLKHERDSEH
ncbi:hypothetical protein SDC9_142811 [bioreactor metagenome]|uniref:Uncharacterized protein n=1 Tax=bioreactor metagenome TaxID=1076179 RepID=A0A645E267_9ZZZZ